MSYILDALRRADAERERGSVPGLHAQATLGDVAPPARDRRSVLLAAAGVGGLVVAVAAVFVLAPWRGNGAPGEVRRADAEPSRAPAVAPAPVPAPAATPAPATSPQPAGATPQAGMTELAALGPDGSVRSIAVPSTPPDVDEGRAALPPHAPSGRVAAPEARGATTLPPPPTARTAPPDAGGMGHGAAARTATGANTPPRSAADAAHGAPQGVEHYGPPLTNPPPSAAPANATAPAPTPPAPAPAPPAAGIAKNINELPPTLRSQLPRLGVGGAIYSETPSGRMLILNGQIYHEGDRPAPDTVLEQIRLKSAVLNWRGMRYEITY